jgi:hypothetical protein
VKNLINKINCSKFETEQNLSKVNCKHSKIKAKYNLTVVRPIIGKNICKLMIKKYFELSFDTTFYLKLCIANNI